MHSKKKHVGGDVLLNKIDNEYNERIKFFEESYKFQPINNHYIVIFLIYISIENYQIYCYLFYFSFQQFNYSSTIHRASALYFPFLCYFL